MGCFAKSYFRSRSRNLAGPPQRTQFQWLFGTPPVHRSKPMVDGRRAERKAQRQARRRARLLAQAGR